MFWTPTIAFNEAVVYSCFKGDNYIKLCPLILAVAWHPINETLFCSGGSDGSIMFWQAG